ncbi:TlpA family protein disulfide reductase [Galbibacter sp.]|uniref:TlpA family protein disulfide reductase n=1 Tax=Galbibacter sp. TaxID=2918471 RepID=UPI003A950BE2
MLRNLIALFTFFIIYTSCELKEDNPLNTDSVIITGTVHQFDRNNVEMYYLFSQPGRKQEKIPIALDSLGKFRFELKSSLPMDALIVDKKTMSFINFIYHPGDSINIEFSAVDNSMSLLKTVCFTGDRKETNNDLILFQRLREENRLGYDVIDPTKAYQLDVKEFIQKMDTVKQNQLKFYNHFIYELLPNDEVKQWTRQYVLQSYYNYLDEYSMGKKNLPCDYFDYNKEILPLTPEKLVGWSNLSSRINSYWMNIVVKNIVASAPDNIEGAKNFDADSLLLNYFNSNIQDKLLSELLIARYYRSQLEGNRIEGFEKHETEIATMIKTPLIMNNLKNNYSSARAFLNKPDIYTKEVLKNMNGIPMEDTFSTILEENQGKVLFIDFWATWCGPCIKAMPDSKKLIEVYQGKEVAFIYICIESEDDLWRRMVSDFNLGGGKHYLLNWEQSSYFRKDLDIPAIPEYILIDKDKNIVEKGRHLSPGAKLTKEKIDELLY